MGTRSSIANLWQLVRELNVHAIREAASRRIVLGVVGAPGSGKSTLIRALRHGGSDRAPASAIEANLDQASAIAGADLLVLVLDATRPGAFEEARLLLDWHDGGRPALVFYNKMDVVEDARAIGTAGESWHGIPVALGSARDPRSLAATFVPQVLAALPDHHLALARQVPLFRPAVARRIVTETARANAGFAFSTGVAETVPLLSLPLAASDMLVLTKTQVFMAYKIGLAYGAPLPWRAHLGALGTIFGAGFFFRQLARELVGMIPLIGLLPKVAVAFGGTVAVGEVTRRWYDTRQALSPADRQKLLSRALDRGMSVAGLLAREAMAGARRLLRPRDHFICTQCGHVNPLGARFCGYCAAPRTRQSVRRPDRPPLTATTH